MTLLYSIQGIPLGIFLHRDIHVILAVKAPYQLPIHWLPLYHALFIPSFSFLLDMSSPLCSRIPLLVLLLQVDPLPAEHFLLLLFASKTILYFFHVGISTEPI